MLKTWTIYLYAIKSTLETYLNIIGVKLIRNASTRISRLARIKTPRFSLSTPWADDNRSV